jgi:hypothetical protein
MTESLTYARVSTKVPSRYREPFLVDVEKAGRTEVIGLVMMRFRAPCNSRMVMLFDLFGWEDYKKKKWGIFPVEIEFVEFLDTVPVYETNRLMVAMGISKDVRRLVDNAGGVSSIDPDDIEWKFLSACYSAFTEGLLRMATESTSDPLERGAFWKKNTETIMALRGIVDKARADRVEVLRAQAAKLDKTIWAQKQLCAIDEELRKKCLLLAGSRTPESCLITLRFHFGDGKKTVHCEGVHKEILLMYKGPSHAFLTDETRRDYDCHSIKSVDNAVHAVTILYADHVTGTVDSVLECVPLFIQLECTELTKRAIDYVCERATPSILGAILVTAKSVGEKYNEPLYETARLLLKHVFVERRPLFDALIKLAKTPGWNKSVAVQ